VAMLASFLKNPVKHFFQQRLAVVFTQDDEASPDDEPFELDGLEDFGLLAQVTGELSAGDATGLEALAQQVQDTLARTRRAGHLPMAEIGRRAETRLIEAALRHASGALEVDDWLDGLRYDPQGDGEPGWLQLVASRLCTKGDKPALRPDKLLAAWVRCLVAGACGVVAHGVLVGRDVTVTFSPMEQAEARARLEDLLAAWQAGMVAPLPVACLTAMAWLAGDNAEAAYEGDGFFATAEADEPCLARVYPDYESLTADGSFETWAEQLYRPVLDWVDRHVGFEPHPVFEQARSESPAA